VKNWRFGHLGAWVAAGSLLATGIAIRVSNAFQYKILWGFDSKFNWRYIRRLMESWTLPAPDADWSTAHPPLYYYLSAAVCRLLDHPDKAANVITLRLLGTGAGLVAIGLAVALVWRTDPTNRRRTLLAGALLLFLPVHIYMSAMLNEEILVSSLISVVLVGLAWEFQGSSEPRGSRLRAAGLGIAAGLALLTKLTGVLVAVAAAVAYILDGWRRDELRRALSCAAILVAMTLLVGGWYYARNWIGYGYLYPHGLQTHKIMFTMPPGERTLADYVRVPLTTWTDPQVLDPDLLHSIWGTTYVTLWFDGHRHFLPTDNDRVTRVGTLILLLALLPTAAFAVGLARGLRRALRSPRGPDALFLLIVAITLAGYVLFTWRNPWFPVLKASFLLGLSVPFSFYASEVLADWTRGGKLRSALVWALLIALVVSISATFTFSELFWNIHHMKKPGVVW
jgi:4-amino-4-deoxy-L-arabinose transferase-like glycosyltransferase